MRNRIWKKFTLALLVVAFAPIIYFGAQDWFSAQARVEDETLREIFLNCVTRAKDIERSFINALADARYLRSSVAVEFYLDTRQQEPAFALNWQKVVEREFTRFLSLKPGYAQAGLLDDYGEELAIVMRSGKGLTVLDDFAKHNKLTAPFYVAAGEAPPDGVAAIAMRSAVPPGMELDRVTLIRYAVKVMGPAAPRGVLYIDLNGWEVREGLERASFEQRRPAALVTQDGDYIFNPFDAGESADPRKRMENLNDHLPRQVVSQMLSGKPGIIADDPSTLFAYAPVYPRPGDPASFYVVMDRYPKALLADRIGQIQRRYLSGALGTLLLIAVIAVMVSRALTRQVKRLQEGVERFARHEFDHRINIASGDEIEDLASAYNAMAASLKEYNESLELKVAERSLRIQQVERQLMQSEKLAALGFLSAGVAHEINNPIAIIITRLELIEKALAQGKVDRVRGDLQALHSHARRIGEIAGSLLTFSREPSRGLAAVDVAQAARRVMNLIGHPIAQKGVRVRLALDGPVPLARANAHGLEQVIYNIVYNAYQVTRAGDEISLTLAADGPGAVTLTIADTGPGIAPETLPHIFEPFFTTKEVGQGAGLGLSISYGIVKEAGGSLRAESVPGKGAAFLVTLPAAPASGPSSAGSTVPEAAAHA